MKNRVKAALADDVKSMVKDRRSGSGGKNGAAPVSVAHYDDGSTAPVYPSAKSQASQLTPDDRATAQHFLAEAQEGRAIMERTQAAYEAFGRHLKAEYGVSGQDTISFRTGVITRATAQPDDVALGRSKPD